MKNYENSLEDDNDWAPSLIITADKAREITGTVFLDGSTGGIGVERTGDGVYEPDEEQEISGVKVELYEIQKDQDGNPIYDENGNVRISNTISGRTKYNNEQDGGTGSDGYFEISGFIPGEYVIVYTWGDKTYIAGNINNPINVNDYKGTIYINKDRQDNEVWYKNYDYENIRYSDALDDYGTREIIDGNNSNNVNTMNSKTPTMNFGIEYKDDIEEATGKATGRSEYDAHKDGKLIFEVPNVDFGIVERARQQLDIDKRVKTVKITLGNSQTIVDAEVVIEKGDINNDGMLTVKDDVVPIQDYIGNRGTLTEDEKLRADVNGDGSITIVDAIEVQEMIAGIEEIKYKLEGDTVNGVSYMGPSKENTPKNGYLKAEIDNELIQSSTLEIGYEIVVKNNSELDYATENYYLYGELGTDADIITLTPTGVYDYLDSEMKLVPDSNWEIVEKASDINYNEVTSETEPTEIEKYLAYTYSISEDGKFINVTGYEEFYEAYYEEIEEWNRDNIKIARENRLTDKTILENINTELQEPIKPGEYKTASLSASKYLANTDEIELNNDVEVTKVTRNFEAGRKITPHSSTLYDKGEEVTVTTPTGENRDYTSIIILAISSFIILTTGIIFIKKKILG